jgi:hypothetical protein
MSQNAKKKYLEAIRKRYFSADMSPPQGSSNNSHSVRGLTPTAINILSLRDLITIMLYSMIVDMRAFKVV